MRPDAQTARRYVLLSIFGLLAISAYRGKLTSNQGGIGFAKRIWGVGWLAIMLGVAADVAPTIAGPMALLILLGSFTSGGDKAIQNMLGKLGSVNVTPTNTKTNVTGPSHPGANP